MSDLVGKLMSYGNEPLTYTNNNNLKYIV